MAGSSIAGMAELNAAFKNLSAEMQRKAGPRMVLAAANKVKQRAKTNAQADGLRKTGAFIKNIAVKREKKAPDGTVQYNVGVRHGHALGNGKKVVKYLAVGKSGRVISKRANDPFYWRFLEFGTKYITAKKPITNAFEQTSAELIPAMQAELEKTITKANSQK